jgi:hypothetical protein
MLRDWLHKPKSLHPPIQDAVWKIALDGKNLVSGICEIPTDDAVGYRGDATTPVLSIAGAVVAVVCRDRILTSRGYGYANIDRKVPMTPNTTAVQVGSVSKLFTWTAAMQLADSRQLNLDAPIYGYLDFHLTTTFDTPITMRNQTPPGFSNRARPASFPQLIAPKLCWGLGGDCWCSRTKNGQNTAFFNESN